jgi:glycerol-3-phosphate dehydrogenase (NAD(P)+)
MFTAEAAYQLSKKFGVEMPITEAIYNVINGKLNVSDALEALMGRPRKSEI